MAKGRMLQNRVSKSNKLASLSSDTVRLLYTWMLSHLDVNGNFYADPIMVNNIVFTRLGHSVKTVGAALDELAATGLIVRYKIDGETYINYPDFQEKQPKLNPYKEGTPDIKIMTEESRLNDASVTPTQYKRSKEKRREENKIETRQAPKDGFEDFWKEYPKRINKAEAIQAWNKAEIPSIQFILDAIKKQKQSDQWNTDNGKYIPYPSSWLNKERWNDELPTTRGPRNSSGGSGLSTTPAEWIPEKPISEEQRQANLARVKALTGGDG